MAKIFIVFHSEYGNTAMVANIVATQLRNRGAYVETFPVEEISGKLEKLMEADTILFGTPTRFGNVSAPFKQFMENTGRFWYKQPWRNKLAAGFTVSSTTNGDKLNTLIALALFAAQHGMIWIPLGVLPRFINDQQTDGQNRLASYIGFMGQCGNGQAPSEIHPGDQLTAELFADHILEVTLLHKNQKQENDKK